MKSKMKKNLPKISIITPSYNQANYIEDTILSVLSQNYPNLEYIIIDGGSDDGTLEILKKYEKKLKIISEKDSGQTNAINKGMKISTGDIISYLNSDDMYLPGTLEIVGGRFTNNQDIKWITGRCRIIDNRGIAIRSIITTWKNLWLKKRLFGLDRYSVLLILNYISQPATFWRREILDKIGFFDETLDLSMDYDFWLRLMKNYFPYVIEEDLALFRIQKNSKSYKNYMGQFDEGYRIVRKHTDSRILLFLHKLHDSIVVYTYKHLI